MASPRPVGSTRSPNSFVAGSSSSHHEGCSSSRAGRGAGSRAGSSRMWAGVCSFERSRIYSSTTRGGASSPIRAALAAGRWHSRCSRPRDLGPEDAVAPRSTGRPGPGSDLPSGASWRRLCGLLTGVPVSSASRPSGRPVPRPTGACLVGSAIGASSSEEGPRPSNGHSKAGCPSAAHPSGRAGRSASRDQLGRAASDLDSLLAGQERPKARADGFTAPAGERFGALHGHIERQVVR